MPVLGIVIKDLFAFHFHGLRISTKLCIHSAILRFNLVLIITILPRFILINANDNLHWSIQKRLKRNLRYRAYFDSNGILPFSLSLLLRVTKVVRTN